MAFVGSLYFASSDLSIGHINSQTLDNAVFSLYSINLFH